MRSEAKKDEAAAFIIPCKLSTANMKANSTQQTLCGCVGGKEIKKMKIGGLHTSPQCDSFSSMILPAFGKSDVMSNNSSLRQVPGREIFGEERAKLRSSI